MAELHRAVYCRLGCPTVAEAAGERLQHGCRASEAREFKSCVLRATESVPALARLLLRND